jgi:hypothetical protein
VACVLTPSFAWGESASTARPCGGMRSGLVSAVPPTAQPCRSYGTASWFITSTHSPPGTVLTGLASTMARAPVGSRGSAVTRTSPPGTFTKPVHGVGCTRADVGRLASEKKLKVVPLDGAEAVATSTADSFAFTTPAVTGPLKDGTAR